MVPVLPCSVPYGAEAFCDKGLVMHCVIMNGLTAIDYHYGEILTK